MKVKLLTSVVFDNFTSVPKGQTVEIGTKQGKKLVKSGLAIEIKEPKIKEPQSKEVKEDEEK